MQHLSDRSVLFSFCILLLFWQPAKAANVRPILIDTNAFYQQAPDQRPLSEQFATKINSPPILLSRPQEAPIQVAVLLNSDVEDLINQTFLLAFKRRMAELRIEYQLEIYTSTKANQNDRADLDAYNKIRETKPDYLIVTGLDIVQSRAIEWILRSAKTKVIFYDLATPLKSWVNHSPLMYIGVDQIKATQMLASYLDRQLPDNAKIAALILSSGYLEQMRCNVFLDEMTKYHRPVIRIQTVPDSEIGALRAARKLFKHIRPDFVFSCTQNISNGVVQAIDENTLLKSVQTNSWGLSRQDVDNLTRKRLLVSMLFMWDDLSIAVAEAIKGDMEEQTMPTLFTGRATLMPAELDPESLRLMRLQAFRYSAVLWQ